MPGLSQYQNAAMDPRSPALANNPMSDQDNANLDAMLRNIDSGVAAPSNLGESRAVMPQPAAQSQNPWLEWLMKYMQSKQQGAPAPQAAPQGQPR